MWINRDAPEPSTNTVSFSAAARQQAFDSSWRFFRADASGAEQPGFDDSAWRSLDLPHDWSIEEYGSDAAKSGDGAIWTAGAVPTQVGPFDALRSAGQESTGWVVGGAGWYRKRFSSAGLPRECQVEIVFDGVYMDSDVWLNGQHLGNHPCGYTAFAYDLTPYLRPVGENVLAVRVRNEGKNSRWYSGSGIYRHVWLTVTGNLRVPLWGVFVTTPMVSEQSATIKVATTVENRGEGEQEVIIRVRLREPEGAEAAGAVETMQRVRAGEAIETVQAILVTNPRLWSPETPNLYRAEVELLIARRTAYRSEVVFGIRGIELDAVKGLRINGEVVKLRGACVHHDNGLLGAVAIDRAEERWVELLKASGFNAVRCSHNPPSSAFLDACDRLGMLVIDEAFDQWEVAKKPDDYHRFFKDWWRRDIESMVLRGRNHPSVIFWSIGNEIPERAEPEGVEIARQLREAVKRLDPTRAITAGICGFWDHPGKEWPELEPAFTHLDVAGYNYKWKRYESDHELHPERIIVGAETYAREAFENEAVARKHPYVIGDFVWTGMDYLGESGIGHSRLKGDNNVPIRPFPWFNAFCGDIDLIGQKKPQSYYRDVVWGRSSLEMAVARPLPMGRVEEISDWGWSDEMRSWTWPGCDGVPLKVRVYAAGDQVRLLLNGHPIGARPVSGETKFTAEFEVPYVPGELRAVALTNEQEIASLVFQTAGKPAQLRLTADRACLRADRNDLAFITVEAVDEHGSLVPDAVIPVAFHVNERGELAAVGNANPQDVASFRQPRRCKTFQGKCLVVLRPFGSVGTLRLRAEAQGISSAEVELVVTDQGDLDQD